MTIVRDILIWGLLLTIAASGAGSSPAPGSKASIVLTSQENGTQPQTEFFCRGKIHGYIRLPKRQADEHLLESRWISPAGKVVAATRDSVIFRPARSTAYIWFAFPDRPVLGAADPELDQELLSYNGTWQLDIRWDDAPLLQTRFNIRCP